MQSSDMARPAAAVTANGPREDDHAGQRDGFSNSKSSPKQQARLRDELAAARQHLESRARNNEVMIAWRDELQRRIARSQFRFEAIGLHTDEQHALQAEVDEFRRVAAYLNWRPGRSA